MLKVAELLLGRKFDRSLLFGGDLISCVFSYCAWCVNLFGRFHVLSTFYYLGLVLLNIQSYFVRMRSIDYLTSP
jgi:hypothetical protein